MLIKDLIEAAENLGDSFVVGESVVLGGAYYRVTKTGTYETAEVERAFEATEAVLLRPRPK
jgi:hypothetical protein